MSFGFLIGVLTSLVLLAVPVVAAILVGMFLRGRARTLGVIGFAVFAVEAVLGGLWVLLAPQLLRGPDIAVVTGIYSVIRSVLAVVGLLLLAFALINAAGRRPDPAGYPGMR